MRISRLQLQMLLADGWALRKALWRLICWRMRERPPELVAQLEAERLQRVMRGEP
jgi:hypothetical protein